MNETTTCEVIHLLLLLLGLEDKGQTAVQSNLRKSTYKHDHSVIAPCTTHLQQRQQHGQRLRLDILAVQIAILDVRTELDGRRTDGRKRGRTEERHGMA